MLPSVGILILNLFGITNFDVLGQSVSHISVWCLRMSSLYLQDANGPSAESILAFSDSVMLLILPIAFGVLAFLVSLLFKTFTYRALVEHQSLEFT